VLIAYYYNSVFIQEGALTVGWGYTILQRGVTWSTLRIRIFADSSVRPSDLRDGTYEEFINGKSEQMEKNGWVVHAVDVEGTYHPSADHPKYEMLTVIQYSKPLRSRLRIRITKFFVDVSHKFRSL
jgi:hypothetical protein